MRDLRVKVSCTGEACAANRDVLPEIPRETSYKGAACEAAGRFSDDGRWIPCTTRRPTSSAPRGEPFVVLLGAASVSAALVLAAWVLAALALVQQGAQLFDLHVEPVTRVTLEHLGDVRVVVRVLPAQRRHRHGENRERQAQLADRFAQRRRFERDAPGVGAPRRNDVGLRSRFGHEPRRNCSESVHSSIEAE